jgi:branched-chain amino acid transport system ATP-binding protein
MNRRDAPALRVEGLDVVRAGLWILRDVGLEIGPGEVLAVLGGAGAGKTVLLGALALGEGVRAGRIVLPAGEVSRAGPLARRRAGLACAFEEPPVIPGFAVADHLALGMPPGPAAARRLEQVLAALPELRPLLRSRVDALPFPLRRLADLGRAVAAARTVLLVDRPLADFGAARITRLVEGLRQDGVGVLLADRHIRPALQIADRAVLLVGGRIVLEGRPLDLLADERVFAACVGDVTSADVFGTGGPGKATARTIAGRHP